MWLLSHEGDVLEGRRIWLRPGSSHLLGRTSGKPPAGEHRCYIDDKSVSRKHLVLAVAAVEPGDSAHLSAKIIVTATDNSRSGTKINGDALNQSNLELDGSQRSYTIRLGTYNKPFLLEWKPVVLSFTGVSKADKRDGIALQREKSMLEDAGFKLITDIVPARTTHVVASKRNTFESLQAIVLAKWLVTDGFVKAVGVACKRIGVDPSTAPLEDDFEANWPDELQHVVPSGGEPVSRPNHFLKPDPTRGEVFSQYTFVFFSQPQHDKVLSAIAGGGGKAAVCEVRPETTADDIVTFVKQVAGAKDARSLQLTQTSDVGGVVLVHLRNGDERAVAIITDALTSLDQRAIEQNELLDAALMKDTSTFRRSLLDPTQHNNDQQMEDAPSRSSNMAQESAATSTSQRPMPSVEPTGTQSGPAAENGRLSNSAENHSHVGETDETSIQQPPTRRRNRRIITQPRANFDDDFDPNQIIRLDTPEPTPSQQQPTQQQPSQRQQSQAPSVQSVDADDTPGQVSQTQRSSRKRPAPAEVEELEETAEERNARLNPAMTAFKRRKLEEDQKKKKKKKNGGSTSTVSTPEPDSAAALSKETKNGKAEKFEKGKKGKKKAEDPTRAKIRANLEEEDERRRKDEESLEEIRNLDPSTIKPIQHEPCYFDVPAELPLRPAPRETYADHPEWNGRQNFKRFRRNRDPNAPNARDLDSQRALVPLVPVPGKGIGITADGWLDHGDKDNTQSQSQTQSQIGGHRQAIDEDEDDAHAFRRRVRRSREEDQANAEADASIPDGNPRGTVGSSQTLMGSVTQSKSRGKRPASAMGEASTPTRSAKKPRQTALAGGRGPLSKTLGNVDDEDPTAFKRKRR